MPRSAEHPVEYHDPDEDFVLSDELPRHGAADVRRGERPVLTRILRVIVFLLLLVVILGGALFTAIHYRLLDPTALGIDRFLDGTIWNGGGPASQPGAGADVIFNGDAATLSAPPGNTVQAEPSGLAAWLRTSVKSASAEGATDGVSAVIPAALLPKFEGRRVRITISAKSAAEGTPIPFAAAYSAGAKGNSNWVVFVPEKMFTDHTFSFVVPIGAIGATDEEQRIAIWADIEGRGSPLAVRSITIQPD